MLVSVCYIDLLSVLVFLTFILFVFREQKMVQRIHEIVAKYEDRLREVWFLVKILVGDSESRNGIRTTVTKLWL